MGALCGWAALEHEALALGVPPSQVRVGALAAGLCIFLVAALTWILDLEEPAAYSTALLALLVPRGSQLAFTASVLLSTALVAGRSWSGASASTSAGPTFERIADLDCDVAIVDRN